MKLLYCERCGDIIAPYRDIKKPRYCICATHAVWWEDPVKGLLRVCDTVGDKGYPHVAAEAYVIGITNAFLSYPGKLSLKTIEDIIDMHDDYYLFKRQQSCVIRIRPGETGDTMWAPLPEKNDG